MTCPEALRAILEADPSELDGRGEGPLPLHLRECPRCLAMARAILNEQDGLAAGMVAAVPSPNVDMLLDQGLGDVPDQGLGDEPAQGMRSGPRSRRISFALLPLAAAAAVAALFLGHRPSLPGDPYIPNQGAPGLGLETEEGQNVAVLATDNPDITVLWFF